MKKFTKILAIILCLTLVLTMFAGCGANGTYYLVVNGEKSDSWIKISGDTWESSDGLSGPCEVDGNEITLQSTLLGSTFDLMTGTKDGNTIDFGLLEYQK